MDFKEKFLYHIWDEGHIQTELRTVCGKAVNVVYSGQLNTNRGPDFINAVIQIEGEYRTGCIEIHFHAQDWIHHHHHEDPHYNNVVLHVVYEHSCGDDVTIKENGDCVEILAIKNYLVEDINKLLIAHANDADDYRIHYCDLLSMINKERLNPILFHYGMNRFHSKVKRYNAVLLNSDFDQVLYEGLMEAIGYDKNKFNLLNIAQTLKWKQWKQWFAQGMTKQDMIAIVLHNSGLLDRAEKLLKQEYVKTLITAYENQNFDARKFPIDWQLFRIRPQNHPVYRIIALISVLFPALEHGLFQYLRATLFQDGIEIDHKALKTLFIAPKDHAYPGIGQSVSANIVVNILLPIFYLYFDKFGDTKRKEEIVLLYQSHPGLMDNRVLKFMKTHASQSSVKVIDSRVVRQQGLIDLYYRFCRYHLCDACVANYRNSLSE